MIFSIMLWNASIDVVKAATLVSSQSFSGGSFYREFNLASDGSSTSSTTTVGMSTGTTSGTITQGTTTYTVRLNDSNSVSNNTTNSTTISRASYQVDLSFTMGFSFGTQLDPSHLYSVIVDAVPSGHYVVAPDGSSVSCTGINSYVLFQGKRYECGESWHVDFMKHTSNASSFTYVVDMSYIVTTPPYNASGIYKLGVNIDKVNLSVYDYGLYSGTDDLKGSVDTGNNISQEGNNIAQEGNELQKEQNETSKNIFDKISDFFGSFFENIINAFKSLFVPEDGYFEDFFTRLNDFFAEKLGMLYAPIDLFIRFLTGINNAGASEVGIPFPGIKWGDTWLIEPQTISLQSYAEEFPELQEKIYFVTDIMMVGAVLLLLQNKLREVMSN